jgi:hypothetical protein
MSHILPGHLTGYLAICEAPKEPIKAVCAYSKCKTPFIKKGRTDKYCKPACSKAAKVLRDAKAYAKQKARAKG